MIVGVIQTPLFESEVISKCAGNYLNIIRIVKITLYSKFHFTLSTILLFNCIPTLSCVNYLLSL